MCKQMPLKASPEGQLRTDQGTTTQAKGKVVWGVVYGVLAFQGWRFRVPSARGNLIHLTFLSNVADYTYILGTFKLVPEAIVVCFDALLIFFGE